MTISIDETCLILGLRGFSLLQPPRTAKIFSSVSNLVRVWNSSLELGLESIDLPRTVSAQEKEIGYSVSAQDTVLVWEAELPVRRSTRPVWIGADSGTLFLLRWSSHISFGCPTLVPAETWMGRKETGLSRSPSMCAMLECHWDFNIHSGLNKIIQVECLFINSYQEKKLDTTSLQEVESQQWTGRPLIPIHSLIVSRGKVAQSGHHSRSWTLVRPTCMNSWNKARRARSLEGKAMRNKLPGNILIHQSQLGSQYKLRGSKTSNYSTMSHNGSAIRQDPRHKKECTKSKREASKDVL